MRSSKRGARPASSAVSRRPRRRARQDQVKLQASSRISSPMRSASRSPRSISRRSKSRPRRESRSVLAWRNRVRLFMVALGHHRQGSARRAEKFRPHPLQRHVERHARHRNFRRKGGQQARRQRARQDHEQPLVALPPDQPAERLRQPRADHPVVIGAAAIGQPARRVEHRRPRPRHPLHHHQPQRFARHVDPVAQRIGAEQRGVRIVAENVDQRAGIDRVDMLGEQRQSGPRQPVGDPGMDRRAAAGSR